jgi:hypothetical protein
LVSVICGNYAILHGYSQGQNVILHILKKGIRMPLWRFMDYHTEQGINLVSQWYEAQDEEIRADFDATLLLLAATEDWTHKRVKAFKVLTGKHAGLCEIRFTVEVERKKKRRFRPLGVWRKDSRDFVLIGGCEKSGRMLIPPNAFELALRYKAEFEGGRGKVYEHT